MGHLLRSPVPERWKNIMSLRPSLETARLLLRPFLLTDAQDVQRLAGDKAVAEPTSAIPHPYEDGMAEAWISTHQSAFDSGKMTSFAIILKASNTLIGAISLLNISDDGHRAELGYWIGRKFWEQGYGTEAARAVMEYGFSELYLNRIHGRCLKRNRGSGRVLEKAGMRYEGCQRGHENKEQKFEDIMLYGILKSEWTNSPSTSQSIGTSFTMRMLLRRLRLRCTPR
jgi:ribosomal-protein-alanine N-acetyltransferase